MIRNVEEEDFLTLQIAFRGNFGSKFRNSISMSPQGHLEMGVDKWSISSKLDEEMNPLDRRDAKSNKPIGKEMEERGETRKMALIR